MTYKRLLNDCYSWHPPPIWTYLSLFPPSAVTSYASFEICILNKFICKQSFFILVSVAQYPWHWISQWAPPRDHFLFTASVTEKVFCLFLVIFIVSCIFTYILHPLHLNTWRRKMEEPQKRKRRVRSSLFWMLWRTISNIWAMSYHLLMPFYSPELSFFRYEHEAYLLG